MDAKHVIDRIQAWLEPLDSLPLECDGMTRVITALLSENGIDHKVMGGHLTDVASVRDHASPLGSLRSCPHWWIELPSGHLIDYRARMWMGEVAQHGVFIKDSTHVDYLNKQEVDMGSLPISVLSIMAMRDLTKHPKIQVTSAELKLLHKPSKVVEIEDGYSLNP